MSALPGRVPQATSKAASWGLVTLRERLLDLLFPPRCAGCGRLGENFCGGCVAQVAYVSAPLCRLCGRPLTTRSSLCARCYSSPPHIDGLRAVAFHEQGLRSAIHALKYKNQASIALPLAGLLAAWLAASDWQIDLIIAVPLHPVRERERGYNQALLLARELARASKIRMVDDVIVRVRPTRDQIGLGPTARRENVQDAFQAVGSHLMGQRVLLVDDVVTTGATLEACAAAAEKGGASHVFGLAVARPRPAEIQTDQGEI